MATFSECFEMIRRLLECAELSQDDIEPETEGLIEEARELLFNAGVP
jgi:hypothetical protein